MTTRKTSLKALLVYPEFPDTFWSFRHALHFERKRSAFPPLGLLTIAALLPRHWEVRLLDANIEPVTDAALAWADVVFLSAMLVQKRSLADITRRARALGKRVVVGGPYVTTSVDALPEADHLVLGEAETLVSELAYGIEGDSCPRVFSARERPDLSLAPLPEFRLARLGAYSAMAVQYSRGCPFRCEFCDIIEIYGRVPRTKSAEQLLAELDALRESGWRGMVFIVDDNFIGNKKNVKLLLPELAEWNERHGHPFSFTTEASVNLAEDSALLEMMRRANFRRVFLGIETPVEESLREAQKSQNTRGDLLESVHKIQSYGMEVMAGFIVGFDSDPADIFDLQIRFIRESAIPVAMVGLLTALPDTQLWRRLALEGRLLTESTGDNTDCSLNFVPKMNTEALLDGYRRVLATIYSPDEFYRRALATLERVAWPREPRRGSLLENLAALGRIVAELGVRDGARGEFWAYFAEAATRHHARFAQAMQLAAMGYHLRMLAQRAVAVDDDDATTTDASGAFAHL